jgi:hypothetical protein
MASRSEYSLRQSGHRTQIPSSSHSGSVTNREHLGQEMADMLNHVSRRICCGKSKILIPTSYIEHQTSP